MAGPSIYYGIVNAAQGIVGSIGLGGFAAIIGSMCFILGVVTKHYWTKADWSLRRHFASRTSEDLGTTGVTQLPSTPSGATTRPTTSTSEINTVQSKEEKPLATEEVTEKT